MKMHLIKIIKNSKIKSDDEQVVYYFKNSPISTEIDLSYMRPLKREKVREKFNTFCYRDELSAVSYEDALVLPGNNQLGGVIDSSGQFVEASKTLWFGGAYDVEMTKQWDMTKELLFF